MSHFSVMVIGDDHEAQLQPYHEYECTGLDDQYVVDVDRTDEARSEHAGSLARGFPGMPEDFAAFVEWYYGRPLNAEGKLVDRTNPNAKWDWWVVGGRWSGTLRLKPGCKGSVGEKGLMGSCSNKGDLWVDQARKCDIDFAFMQDHAAGEAGARWDKAFKARGGKDWMTWDQVRQRHEDIAKARGEYHGQDTLKAAKQADPDGLAWDADWCLQSREQYVQTARDNAISAFAFVKDSQWFERGEMGWWGMVSDEKDRQEWNGTFASMLESLPDDTLITVVDCHI